MKYRLRNMTPRLSRVESTATLIHGESAVQRYSRHTRVLEGVERGRFHVSGGRRNASRFRELSTPSRAQDAVRKG